ncbi:MAG: hypothetical protein ACRDSP_10630 [Pseudonocardiaceae bacterium]
MSVVRDVIDVSGFVILVVLVFGVCVFGGVVVMSFTRLVWRIRDAARCGGRHRRVGTWRLLPAGTEVTAVVDDHMSRGVVEGPTTDIDRDSGVFPVCFPFGVRLMCTDDVAVVIGSALVGAR